MNNVTINSFVWTAQEQNDALLAYVDQDKYLSARKGQYAERNDALWFSHLRRNTRTNFQVESL